MAATLPEPAAVCVGAGGMDARQSVAELLAQLQRPSSASSGGRSQRPREAEAARIMSRVDALLERQERAMRGMSERVDEVVRATNLVAAPGTPSTCMPESHLDFPDSDAEGEAEELETPQASARLAGGFAGSPTAAGPAAAALGAPFGERPVRAEPPQPAARPVSVPALALPTPGQDRPSTPPAAPAEPEGAVAQMLARLQEARNLPVAAPAEPEGAVAQLLARLQAMRQ
mmetsp:Transcript_110404/g.330204  ORF Transcript_110404/g.330204 Transcript_110404/m.330204 type:complete len:230 (+) Transcript_110404:80-769(+)